MELDYWKNKLDRFTITEITSGFKNSQKIDTQLISKYAFHYLKTYFDKVDVQKGSITAEFRKIYQLQVPDEKKDRSKHSHHAKDAAVLTLIPVAAKRDEILEKYYEAKENKTSFTTEPPFKGFKREFVWNIDDNVLINNITNNQELTPAKRKVRKRGKEVFIEKPDGTKVNKWATGDTIRGELHGDTFYGAIKPAQKGEKGNLLKDENGKFIQEEKVKYVVRVPFQYKKDANTKGVKELNQIVDEGIKRQIQNIINTRKCSFKDIFNDDIYLLDKNSKSHGNKIRHIRVWASVSEPLAIKKQTYLSSKDYKQYYYAANATNSYFALYEDREKTKKDFDFRNLMQVAQALTVENIRNEKDLFAPFITIKKGKTERQLDLKYILKPGARVIFLKDGENKNDLTESDYFKRLYVYTNFEKDGRLNFKYHLEARNKIEEKYSESDIDWESPKPTMRFGFSKYDFLVEEYDFEVMMDGVIKIIEE